jgi:hypothetical protein
MGSPFALLKKPTDKQEKRLASLAQSLLRTLLRNDMPTERWRILARMICARERVEGEGELLTPPYTWSLCTLARSLLEEDVRTICLMA